MLLRLRGPVSSASATAAALGLLGLVLSLPAAAAELSTADILRNNQALKPAVTEGAPAAAAPAQPAPARPAPVKAKPKPKPKPQTQAKADSGAKVSASPTSRSEQAIVALVNDEPITGYEVQQRAGMLSGGSMAEYMRANAQARWKSMITGKGIQEEFKAYMQRHQPKSKEEAEALQKKFIMGKQETLKSQLAAEARAHALPGARKQALDELIDEKLKLQEAKKNNVTVSDEDVDRAIKTMAERSNMTIDQMKQQLGGSMDPMKTRIRSTLSWNEVVRRRFGGQITVSSREVDRFVATSGKAAEDQVELVVQRIRLTIPVKMEEAGVAKRISEAETLRSRFTDCKSTSALANGVAGAKYEDVGRRRPSAFPEPTRSMLLNAKDGEMLPPTVGEGGVELWAVCGRTVIKAEEQSRNEAEGELKQKEFEVMAKRHLKDLRQDAHIEYR